ncbi:50S ribosomal protein L24 [Candidatus Woesearchaeota archaeon CG10_big_fil_rev_8_21_14_0_10_37_12]|nr:MAG: 50S ribosomal protein L24 [Candidatus Woesearchaeota archaeon CG10_big_fil_rev_8_21_14_0_10_37_12]
MNWSTTWKSSKKPSKQRKYVRNAPPHIRNTMLGSHLTKELREKHKTRSLRVRTGDKVKIMRGQHKGKTGTIEKIDTKRQRAYITGVETVKKDGSKTLYPLRPSNLIIQALKEDKRRITQ